MPKICLIGAGSTGKSSLCEYISIELDIPIVPEYAREVAQEMGFDTLKRPMTKEELVEFGVRIGDMKIKEESCLKNFVADRTLLDNVIYNLAKGLFDDNYEGYKKLLDFALKHIEDSYDAIVLLPFNAKNFKDDGFRNPIMVEEKFNLLLNGIFMTKIGEEFFSNIAIINWDSFEYETIEESGLNLLQEIDSYIDFYRGN